MFNIPIVFAVGVVDGVGDVLHFIDSLATLPTSLLENAYFFVDYNYHGAELEESIDQYEKSLRDSGFYTEDVIQKDIKAYIRMQKKMQEKGDKIKKIINNLSVFQPSNPLTRNTVYYSATNLSEEVKGDCIVWNVSTNCAFHSPNIRLRGTLYEHGFFPKHKIKQHPLQQTMGISQHGNTVGIFIKPSEANKQLNETGVILRKRYKINDGNAVNFCYCHSNTEYNINMLIALHKRSKNADKTQIIIFPQGIPPLSITLLNNLIKENVRLIESLDREGFNDTEIRQFKIMQAQSAACALAVGDTSTQDCINEGLLPVIEYERFEKADFWCDLIEVVETFSKSSQLTKEEQHDAEVIIKYLKDSIDYNVPFAAQRLLVHVETGVWSIDSVPELKSRGITQQPPFVAPPSCSQLTESCFAVWKNQICPYLRRNFNVANNLPASIQLFRMLGELVANDDPINNVAIEFFKRMDREKYAQLVKTLKESEETECLLALQQKIDVLMVFPRLRIS